MFYKVTAAVEKASVQSHRWRPTLRHHPHRPGRDQVGHKNYRRVFYLTVLEWRIHWDITSRVFPCDRGCWPNGNEVAKNIQFRLVYKKEKFEHGIQPQRACVRACTRLSCYFHCTQLNTYTGTCSSIHSSAMYSSMTLPLQWSLYSMTSPQVGLWKTIQLLQIRS